MTGTEGRSGARRGGAGPGTPWERARGLPWSPPPNSPFPPRGPRGRGLPAGARVTVPTSWDAEPEPSTWGQVVDSRKQDVAGRAGRGERKRSGGHVARARPAQRGCAPRLRGAGGAPRGVRAGRVATPPLPSASGQGWLQARAHACAHTHGHAGTQGDRVHVYTHMHAHTGMHVHGHTCARAHRKTCACRHRHTCTHIQRPHSPTSSLRVASGPGSCSGPSPGAEHSQAASRLDMGGLGTSELARDSPCGSG